MYTNIWCQKISLSRKAADVFLAQPAEDRGSYHHSSSVQIDAYAELAKKSNVDYY